MKSPLALLSLLTVILATGSLQAQNLLQNGDFSSGLTGWNVSGVTGPATPGAVLKAEALPDAGGKSGKSARITDEDDKAGISLRQSVPAQAGKAYTLTFMSKTTVPEGQKGTPGYAMIQFLDAKGGWINNPDAPTATGTPTPEERKLIKRDVCNFAAPGKDWQAATLTATAPAGTTKMWIVFKVGNGGRGVVDVSDVMLAPATP